MVYESWVDDAIPFPASDAHSKCAFSPTPMPDGHSSVERDASGFRFVNCPSDRSLRPGVDSRRCGIAALPDAIVMAARGGRAMKMAGRCCEGGGRTWGEKKGRREKADRRNRRQRSTVFPAARSLS